MTTALSRRELISQAAGLAAAGTLATASGAEPSTADRSTPTDGEILGQGRFRYRANRLWGRLDPEEHPVRDGHGISEDRNGRIVLLTNETRNNLIAYSKSGRCLAAWEHGFRGAHGLDIVDRAGEDQYWITDRSQQVVSVRNAEGHEWLRVGPESVASKYPDITKYHPTNTATLPDGDFFISDGYGSSYIHHLDPTGRYMSSFGGEGSGPENLKTPHSVWIDTRSGKPQLLVCDRGHNMIKWFSTAGELLRVLDLGPTLLDDESISLMPANVAPFGGYRCHKPDEHIAIACLPGMILILDGNNRVASAVGGKPPTYVDGKLQQMTVFNYTFNHPHDVCIDSSGALYVSQWWSGRTYPIKLDPIASQTESL